MRAKLEQNKAGTESYLHTVWRRFTYHKVGFVSLWIVLAIVALAVLAPIIAPYDPNAINPEFSAAPSAKHLLGTDAIGRDMFSRLLYGTRVSLLVGALSTLLATAIGTVLGLVAGYFGGAADMIIMRITDTVMSFPYILLILVASVIFSPGMWNIILILGFVDWPGVARLVRGNVMEIRNADYVQAARIEGMPGRYILFSEILPDAMAPILVFATSVMAISILDEAALSFLGMGVQPPQASLGNLLNGAESISVLTGMPWLWVSPGVVIIVLVICTNFIGDALRDAVDPSTTA
ncbi:MAG: ABC transporter permease [Lachnospiraceae bacterium]|jgi:peptide/nickel transport system permease protein|nr:ABC transporter permease [Lachnospiraceae bacterium]MCI1398968.1 ABC transporter permease [Lachnospiraceae bacterium]MCI1424933.1 ABC transporter permease [Lachnospiraceae bacterium]MCI1453618.1 ABC transporter permease [Lachnospiraceae bacterium]MDD5849920.1 ABC transporter permease [Bacillota bacterium]